MILCYSGRSAPGARLIADASDGEIEITRSGRGDVNWGRNIADTGLNADIGNSTNKRVMRELFREHSVPMPELLDVTDEMDMYLYNEWPIVGRPDYHSKGRGYWLCRNMQDVQRALRGTRRKKAATHFMEYIKADREYRVQIFKGRSIRISEKLFDGYREGAPHTLYQYTTIKPTGEYRHVRRAAKEAVAALGLDFGAVDVLATDDECWVLEVNTAPGLGGTMPKVWADTFLKWYEGEWEDG